MRTSTADLDAQPGAKQLQFRYRLRYATDDLLRRYLVRPEQPADVNVLHAQEVGPWMRLVETARWFLEPRMRIDVEAFPPQRRDDFRQRPPGGVGGDRLAESSKRCGLGLVHSRTHPQTVLREGDVAAGDARCKIVLVRLLFREPHVLVDARQPAAPIERRQLIDQQLHRPADRLFVAVLVRLEPLAIVVAFEALPE